MRNLTIKALDLLLGQDIEEFSIDGDGRCWLEGKYIPVAVMESLSPETLTHVTEQYRQEVQNLLSNLANKASGA